MLMTKKTEIKIKLENLLLNCKNKNLPSRTEKPDTDNATQTETTRKPTKYAPPKSFSEVSEIAKNTTRNIA